MGRPVTLFTGQWADLPLEVLAEKAASWGFDGLELACWGDHFDVQRALDDDDYCQGRHDVLARHGLKVWACAPGPRPFSRGIMLRLTFAPPNW